ncbi:MAG: molybdate ABC transporter substrate-binding protein [Mariniblastus sp.]
MQPSRLLVLSTVAVIALGVCALELNRQSNDSRQNIKTIRVYCAAGIADPIEQLIRQFNTVSDVKAELARSAGSGELAGQINMEFETGLDQHADVFVCSDQILMENAQAKGIIENSFPIATQRLVIAVPADTKQTQNQTFQPASLRTLLQSNLRFGIASKTAAVGKLTRQVGANEFVLEQLESQKKLDAENVMTLAQALATGSLDAAVVWDTTVTQVNDQSKIPTLKVATILAPDLSSHISAGILSTANEHSACENLIQFLLSKSSQQHLQSLGYTVPNDSR